MNFRSHINFLKPFSSRKHRNGLDHIDLWRAPGALVYQKRELLTFVIGEIDNWLIVGIGYYLDNYLPFNNLIPKTWLTNPSHEPVSMFAFMKYCIILWLYDCENKSAFVIQSNEHFLFPLSSLLIRQSRSLLLCRTCENSPPKLIASLTFWTMKCLRNVRGLFHLARQKC